MPDFVYSEVAILRLSEEILLCFSVFPSPLVSLAHFLLFHLMAVTTASFLKALGAQPICFMEGAIRLLSPSIYERVGALPRAPDEQ